MLKTEYSVVTSGEVLEGLSRNDVALQLQKLCKYQKETLQQVFSGKRFVFKSGLDFDTARKYKAALDKTGIVCRITKPASAKQPTPKAPVQLKPEPKTVRCPKCGTEQEDGISCVACQIVMSKYNSSSSFGQYADYAAPAQPHLQAQKSKGFPFLKILAVLLLAVGLGTGVLLLNPFASAKGELHKETGVYENHRYGFALSFPSAWQTYSVDEAISCSTIRREYADAYLLLISPTTPSHCMLVVNISGITLDSFNAKGWQGVVDMTRKRHPVSYQSIDEINGLKVYRVGYDIANSYREDAYFEANGTLIQVYFYVKKSYDTAKIVTEMRRLLDANLQAT